MLIDTNIFIEIPRQQTSYKDCLNLLKLISHELISEDAFITSFTLHALEAMLSKDNADFLKKILLMIHEGKIRMYNSDIPDDLMILSSMKALEFDFDDATQYMATSKLGTYIVTYDKSFYGKGIEVKTPGELIAELKKSI